MVCQKCGSVLNDNDQFCPNCGTQTSPNATSMVVNNEQCEIELPAINMMKPDSVGLMDRNDLLNVFSDIRKITATIDKIYEKTTQLMNEIEQHKQIAEGIRTKKPGWVISGSIIGALFFGIVFIFVLGGFGFVLGLIMGFVASHYFLKNLDMAMNNTKRMKQAEDYLNQTLPPIQNKIKDHQATINDILRSPEASWAEDIIGKELLYSEAVDELINIVKSRRADNLKEALNKYDSSQHLNRMEEMQAAIQNAAELSAVEAIKQTAYAQETAKSAHEAATAAKLTAYNTRQIDRNTRTFRRK